jgi:hypothetical protein
MPSPQLFNLILDPSDPFWSILIPKKTKPLDNQGV